MHATIKRSSHRAPGTTRAGSILVPLGLALLAVSTTACASRPDAPANLPDDINAVFLDEAMDVQAFVERFEGESRAVYTERYAIVEALGLEPGEAAQLGLRGYRRRGDQAPANPGDRAADVLPRRPPRFAGSDAETAPQRVNGLARRLEAARVVLGQLALLDFLLHREELVTQLRHRARGLVHPHVQLIGADRRLGMRADSLGVDGELGIG